MKAGRRKRRGGGVRCLEAMVGALPGKREKKKTLTKRAKLRLLVVTVL